MISRFNKQLKKLLLFSQVNSLIQISKNRPLEMQDTIELPLVVDPKIVHLNEDEVIWAGTNFQLIRSLLWSSRKFLGITFSLLLASELISLSSPFLIHELFVNLQKTLPNGYNAKQISYNCGLATLIGLVGYLCGFTMQHYFHLNLQLMQNIQSYLNRLIFSKSLNLSRKSRESINNGDVVNYMSTDTDASADLCFIVLEALTSSILVVLSIGSLFYFIGWATMGAILVLILLLPLTRRLALSLSTCDKAIMHYRDERISLMGQILGAIRIIKYFAWEKSIENEITDVRNLELKSRQQLFKVHALSGMIYASVSSVALLSSLVLFSYFGGQIDLALILTLVTIFALLEEPFGNFTNLMARFANALVGIERISGFLKLSENVILREECVQPSIEINHLSFSYEKEKEPSQFTLNDLNLRIEGGSSVAIVGPVGAGKSTLLQILLREIKPSSGTLRYLDLKATTIPAQTVYVPQDSYVINASLLENLKFGAEAITGSQIEQALHYSCLQEDLCNFPKGLQTELGERGINLSGGQKQRLALARAFLQRPELILLDDPLSAVDPSTEVQLCERLIFGEWKDKTRVVVTHRLEHLDQFDQVIFMDDGKIVSSGRFSDLVKVSTRFANFVEGTLQSNSLMSSGHISRTTAQTSSQTSSKFDPIEVAQAHNPIHSLELVQTVNRSEPSEDPIPNQNLGCHRITVDEDRERGQVKRELYFSFLKMLGKTTAGGLKASDRRTNWIICGLFSCAIVAKASLLGQKAWLTYGAKSNSTILFLLSYAGISCLGLLINYANMRLWLYRGLQGAKLAHQKMIHGLLGANIRFFDSTPVGRILQRFSRDLESVDEHLIFTHLTAVECFVQMTLSLILIVLALPLILLCLLPLLGFYYQTQRYYRAAAREAKRFDSVARSPRYAHFKETLQGLVVIRAFNKQTWFTSMFYEKLSLSHKMFYNNCMINRWFSIRVPLIGGMIALMTAVGISLSVSFGILSIEIAGLTLVYAMSFWRYLNWAIRIFSEIEARLTSVERLSFISNLPPEEAVISPDWVPAKILNGTVEFRDVWARYAPHLPFVLRGISFKIKSGERVGIIGRTGSGKSTIFQALYRFIELDRGEILLGNLRINQMSRYELRKKLAIIPQDPILFKGSLRANLDRYHEFTDSEILRALERAALGDKIRSSSLGIWQTVAENGQNFSQGQRQLICLARAILQKAVVVVLDEATASVDIVTDAIIQKVIRDHLKGVTLLIIAHRLETIADADQIIRIQEGEIVSIQKISENQYQQFNSSSFGKVPSKENFK